MLRLLLYKVFAFYWHLSFTYYHFPLLFLSLSPPLLYRVQQYSAVRLYWTTTLCTMFLCAWLPRTFLRLIVSCFFGKNWSAVGTIWVSGAVTRSCDGWRIRIERTLIHLLEKPYVNELTNQPSTRILSRSGMRSSSSPYWFREFLLRHFLCRRN